MFLDEAPERSQGFPRCSQFLLHHPIKSIVLLPKLRFLIQFKLVPLLALACLKLRSRHETEGGLLTLLFSCLHSPPSSWWIILQDVLYGVGIWAVGKVFLQLAFGGNISLWSLIFKCGFDASSQISPFPQGASQALEGFSLRTILGVK